MLCAGLIEGKHTFLDDLSVDFLFFVAILSVEPYPAPPFSFFPPSLFLGFFMASSRHSKCSSSVMRRHFFSWSFSFSFS